MTENQRIAAILTLVAEQAADEGGDAAPYCADEADFLSRKAVDALQAARAHGGGK